MCVPVRPAQGSCRARSSGDVATATSRGGESALAVVFGAPYVCGREEGGREGGGDEVSSRLRYHQHYYFYEYSTRTGTTVHVGRDAFAAYKRHQSLPSLRHFCSWLASADTCRIYQTITPRVFTLHR